MLEEKIYYLELKTTPHVADLLAELLAGLELNQAIWHDPDTQEAVIRVYCENADAAEQARVRLSESMQAWNELLGNELPEITCHTLRKEDWTEKWKEFFHAFRVSSRLVVKPSWENFDARPNDIIIELDPGMSFGTGYHGTTRACLEFIDELRDELEMVSFLDAGCGSGILSLAAAKLGFEPIMAFDYDPQAVGIACENLQKSGVENVEFFASDLAEVKPPQKFRLVVANILAVILDKHAERLVSFLDRAHSPSYLILSGIMISQYDGIHKRFCELGLEEISNRAIDEWKSGLFVLR